MRVFYLVNAEAKTVANTLKTILKTKDLISDDKLNMLIMRDTPEAIALAEKLITAHDVTEAEVMLEVEVLEVKDGETQVLAGLLSNDERSSSNKVPGLGELPIAGRLFGSQLDEENKTEIILSITPRIVRNIRRPGGSVLEYDSGTEASLAQTSVARGSITSPNVPRSNVTTSNRADPAGREDRASMAAAKPDTPERNSASAGVTTRWIGPSVVRQGDMVTFQLLVDSSQPVVSIPLSVSFDPKAFQVAGVSEGNFLKRSGAKSNFAHRVEASGQILLTGTLPGESVAQGSGVLATFSLRALSGSPAQTTLRISGLAPVGQKGASIAVAPTEAFSIAVEP